MATALLTPPEITDATRREFLAGLAAAGLLVGCSGAADPDAPAEPATRAFVDSRGVEVQIPASPQRIVALNGNGAQQLLSLGAALVGLATREGELDAEVDLIGLEPEVLDGIEPVGDYNTPDLEAIAALAPDLIVGYELGDGEINVEPAVRERLEQIAPTVFPSTFEPVDEVMAAFGELLGVDARVTEQQQSYQDRIADLRERLPYDPAELVVVDQDVWYQDTALTRMARLDDIERIARDLS